MGRTRKPRIFETRSRPYYPRSRPKTRCVVCETEDAPNGCRVCSTCQNFFNERADPRFDDERCRLRNPRIDPRQRCPACWLDKCRREGMRFTGGARDRDKMESYRSPELRSRPDLSSRENDRERDGGYDVDRGRGDGGYDEDDTSTYGDIDDRVRDSHYQERSPYSDMGEENGRYRYRDHFSEREERNGRYQSRGSFSYMREKYVDRDFFSDGGEEIRKWNRTNTPDRRPFGLARDSRHSLSPPRLNGDRQAAAPLVSNWITTVLRSLCALGGKANVNIFFEKIQRQFPDKFRQSPRLFQERLERNPENFNLKKRAGEGYTVSAFTKLQLCPDHCTENGCYNQECDSLHICRFFLVSSCSAEKKNQPCKYGHKFESLHNDALLSQHGLGNLGPGHLKKLFQINRSEATLPTACKFYNNVGGCNRKDGKGKCWAMHICRPFLKRECKFGANCKRSHNILDEQPRTILLQYGFDTKQSPDKLLLELTEQINRS